ncbi:hypothetical protein T492DRAFT_142281 [Pavlovales sp. CCMP2436]|nr:hypothetical protein T492DRAFT_142281 [Pavlovales sp. CCMP2436]
MPPSSPPTPPLPHPFTHTFSLSLSDTHAHTHTQTTHIHTHTHTHTHTHSRVSRSPSTARARSTSQSGGAAPTNSAPKMSCAHRPSLSCGRISTSWGAATPRPSRRTPAVARGCAQHSPSKRGSGDSLAVGGNYAVGKRLTQNTRVCGVGEGGGGM